MTEGGEKFFCGVALQNVVVFPAGGGKAVAIVTQWGDSGDPQTFTPDFDEKIGEKLAGIGGSSFSIVTSLYSTKVHFIFSLFAPL